MRADIALLELDASSPDELLIAAMHASGRYPELQARVLLQRARILPGTHELRTALELAQRSVELAARAGRPDLEVDALTVAAAASHTPGEGSARGLIEKASALAGPPRPGQVHTSPRYIAARFALHDDDLRRARSEFVDMLADVGPDAGYDTVHVLRSPGRGRRAPGPWPRGTGAGRPGDPGRDPLRHPGRHHPVHRGHRRDGGRLLRAGGHRQRPGVDPAREQGDERYLRRQLAHPGLAQLHLDDWPRPSPPSASCARSTPPAPSVT
uniref:Uncharacterized protein n=1 Tax=Janibacter limosus TaxID=53458 RepID=A0AC61U4X0_9MICO|nr:hypothetical protein [Janibacter limosus]